MSQSKEPRISFRVSSEIHEEIEKAALVKGLKVATFVRMVAIEQARKVNNGA